MVISLLVLLYLLMIKVMWICLVCIFCIKICSGIDGGINSNGCLILCILKFGVFLLNLCFREKFLRWINLIGVFKVLL